ncbi:MAG: hypothetical protein HKN25_13015 [Pyrinomonadaceae bacterium]|nr:hypothetical protein [Pyrinomonadaceae bacterium]
MSVLLLFYEIHDKVTPVFEVYRLFLVVGGIGLALGFLRWWLSAIWLIFPVYFALIFLEELHSLRVDLTSYFGDSYLWHSYNAYAFGLGLNLLGVFVGFRKRKKNRTE